MKPTRPEAIRGSTRQVPVEDAEPLFDPGPPEADGAKRKGEDLYDHGPGPRMARKAENARVRALIEAHLRTKAATEFADRPNPLGAARRDFAWGCVDFCLKEGIPTFGESVKVDAKHSKKNPRHDSAETNLRAFWQGENQYDWMLTCYEAYYNHLHGFALPPGAYTRQQTLPDNGPAHLS